MENEQKLEAAIEAVLFAEGHAVPVSDIARALETDTETIHTAIQNMQKRWLEEERGTEIVRLEDSYQMRTRKEFYPQLIRLELNPQKPRLTDVLLETLSVIAYRQPVTKAEIERIRGVNSDHAVNRLIEYHLVEEVGRAKQPGRPILFGTTREFLRCFGVSSKDSLPDISPVKLEDFREEAEEEAGGENEAPSENKEDKHDGEMQVGI
ncbi:MAG: SMC-Scp complex subunit ScpB [Chordicoccus sp.]